MSEPLSSRCVAKECRKVEIGIGVMELELGSELELWNCGIGVRSCFVHAGGALYHVTARGNARQAIFLDDHDRHRFLDVLARVRSAKRGHCEFLGMTPRPLKPGNQKIAFRLILKASHQPQVLALRDLFVCVTT